MLDCYDAGLGEGSMEWMKYLSEIISFVAGAISGGLVVRWNVNKSRRNEATQSHNVVAGDMAGRDIKKR